MFMHTHCHCWMALVHFGLHQISSWYHWGLRWGLFFKLERPMQLLNFCVLGLVTICCACLWQAAALQMDNPWFYYHLSCKIGAQIKRGLMLVLFSLIRILCCRVLSSEQCKPTDYETQCRDSWSKPVEAALVEIILSRMPLVA
jgi:hypothetical protein